VWALAGKLTGSTTGLLLATVTAIAGALILVLVVRAVRSRA